MKRLIFLSVLTLFALAGNLSACICSGAPTFCQTARPGIIAGVGEVFHVRSLGISAATDFAAQVVVLHTISGRTVPGDTIFIDGQDGVNCAIGLTPFTAGKEAIVNLAVYDTLPPGARYRLRGEVLFCGLNYLEVEDDQVRGRIAPGVDSMTLDEFLTGDASCVNAPFPEECACPAIERDLCDDAALLDQNMHAVRLSRLRMIDTIYRPGYDENGYYVGVRAAVVDEVILGEDFGVGDTVLVRQEYIAGCFPTAPEEGEFVWLHTEVDTFVASLAPWVFNYPLLITEPCIQRFAVIENQRVQTLAGLVSYQTYLADLAECVPALSTDELTLRMQLTVFPNPATDRLNVSWVRENVELAELLDARGRVVATQLPQYTGLLTMDTGSLPAGIYFLRLATDGGIATRRVVVR